MAQRIISIGRDEVAGWELNRVKNNSDIDIMVYNYENEGYEGKGFAVWKSGRKYGYTYMTHCSCNGALEFINEASFTLKELKEMMKAQNPTEQSFAKPVIEAIVEIR